MVEHESIPPNMKIESSDFVTTHNVKTWPQYFQYQWDGIKPFDIRTNDRNYTQNDVLISREYDIETEEYTGRVIVSRILYVYSRDLFGALQSGQCVMGLREIGRHPREEAKS